MTAGKHYAPDRGWAWVIVLAGAGNNLIGLGMYRSFGVLMVELMSVFDTSTTKVSLVLSFISIGFLISSLFYALGLGDVFHERALVLVCTFISFGGYIAGYFSTQLEHIFILSVCVGFSGQVGMSSGLGMVGKYFEKRLSIASSLTMGGVSLGALLMPPMVQFLYDQFSYRGGCLVVAGFVLNGFVAAMLMRPAIPANTTKKIHENSTDMHLRNIPGSMSSAKLAGETADKTEGAFIVELKEHERNGMSNEAFSMDENVTFTRKIHPALASDNSVATNGVRSGMDSEAPATNGSHNGNSTRTKESSFQSFKRFVFQPRKSPTTATSSKTLLSGFAILKKPSFIIFQLFSILSTAASECIVQFLPALASDAGITLQQTSLLLVVVGAGDFASRIALGMLGDYVPRDFLVIVPQFVLGVACFVAKFATEFWSLTLLAGVIGFTFGINYAFRSVLLIDLFGLQNLPRTLGITNLVGSVGVIGCGPLVGYLRDMTGDYGLPMQVVGLFAIGGGLCLAAIYAANMGKRFCVQTKDRYDLS